MTWNTLPMVIARKVIPMPRLPDLRLVRLLAQRIHRAMARSAAPGSLPIATALDRPFRAAHAVATSGLCAPGASGLVLPTTSAVCTRALAPSAGARMRVDPSDRQRTLISGTMHEVCDALDSLIEQEARAQRKH